VRPKPAALTRDRSARHAGADEASMNMRGRGVVWPVFVGVALERSWPDLHVAVEAGQ
jgi:hypothetical protein